MVPCPLGANFFFVHKCCPLPHKNWNTVCQRGACFKGGTKIVVRIIWYCINMISVSHSLLQCSLPGDTAHMKHEQLTFFLHRRGTKYFLKKVSRPSPNPQGKQLTLVIRASNQCVVIRKQSVNRMQDVNLS